MNADPLRVLIVDDSRIFRGSIEEALSQRNDIQIVGSVWSGEKAIEFAQRSLPDFVTLDIEMPGIGGLETLKRLRDMAKAQGKAIGILLISSYTKRGAAVTIEGLEEGAFDFITKPDSADTKANAAFLQRELFSKIDAFRSRRKIALRPGTVSGVPSIPIQRTNRFRAVVIASSTGGPEALNHILAVLGPRCPVPLFLVQHMPASFSEYFVTSLSRRCGFRVVEAGEGMIPVAGVMYVARGGQHLVTQIRGGNVVMGLNDSPPENGCRPAADVLFRSAALAYSGRVLAIVLTGMGTDGANGAVALKRAGAHVIAQDEASSIVWGMPGSVVAAGAADEVLPLDTIARAALAQLGIGA